jgi:hypothetical protein
MDRRSFLKVLGTTLAGCSIVSIAEAAIPSMPNASKRSAESRVPSIKVIGLGRTGINLMQSMPIGPDALINYEQVDYLSIRFNGRITRGIESPDMEWTMPLNYHSWREVADDLHNVAFARQKIHGMERELSAYVKNADVVLMLIGLDNAMSFAACDTVARIARESGALTVALVGMPYGYKYESMPLRIASHDAVNRILKEANCVITADGLWSGSANEFMTWDWYLHGDAPTGLLSAILTASATEDCLGKLKAMLSKSGEAHYELGLGDSAQDAVEYALKMRQDWFDCYEKTTTTDSVIVIVSDHTSSVNTRLNEVKAAFAQISSSKMPHLGSKPEILFLSVADDQLPDGFFFVNVISTGIVSTSIEFAGEA